jgi:hypothetical protein
MMEGDRSGGEEMDDGPRDDTVMESVNASSESPDEESFADDRVEDVEVEVVLLSNDESEGEFPRTLTDGSSSNFRWFMLTPGIVAAGVAALLLLQQRSEGGVSAVTSRFGTLPGIKGVAQKAAPPPKSQWEQARDAVQSVVSDNMVTIIAIAASIGITVAGRLADIRREGPIALPTPPARTPWYRGGLWK